MWNECRERDRIFLLGNSLNTSRSQRNVGHPGPSASCNRAIPGGTVTIGDTKLGEAKLSECESQTNYIPARTWANAIGDLTPTSNPAGSLLTPLGAARSPLHQIRRHSLPLGAFAGREVGRYGNTFCRPQSNQ
jgi:hypothetical protein